MGYLLGQTDHADVMRRILFAGGFWPMIWGLAAVAMIVYLYAVERRLVSRAMGLVLTLLRVTLVVLILAMLGEPTAAIDRTESKTRTLAVLTDVSASMDVTDRQMSLGERLRLADALGRLSEQARPIRLERMGIDLRRAQAELSTATAQWPELGERLKRSNLPTPAAEAMLREAASPVHREVELLNVSLGTLSTILEDRRSLPTRQAAEIVDLHSRLLSQVVEPIRRIEKAMKDPPSPPDRAAERIAIWTRDAQDALRGLTALIEAADQASRNLDDAFAAQADADTRRAMDEVGAFSRRQIADGLLRGGKGNLLVGLSDRVKLRYYRFADEARLAAAPATSAPATDDPNRVSGEGTNLAAAIEQVVRDVPANELAGVVMLTDGRHNATDDPAPIARRLGTQGVPICPVVIGSEVSPPDAAIVRIDAPDQVYAEDTMTIGVSVRLDGLEGRTLAVRLLDEAGKALGLAAGDDEDAHIPSPNAPSKERRITASGPSERREIRLSHKPTGKGRHVYRVTLEAAPNEVFKENNQRTVAVQVGDERVKVLLVDGSPRWEFRYLRNLLLRDPSVQLQHVLFDPADIDRQPRATPIVARVQNREPAADRLPQTNEDLNAYDAILLGDVGPDDLSADLQRRIEQFVADRGGTLALIAGKRHMPTDFMGQPLAALLPVEPEGTPSISPQTQPQGSWLLRLADEGQGHLITELAIEPQTNQSLWDALPPFNWRSAMGRAKGGASVLAWAEPPHRGATTATTTTARAPIDRPPLRRDGAVLVAQNYGLGRVLYIGWDATWRFRYKHGDTYHHKFWAQVLRWAQSGNLPAGLQHVRIGTDRVRYPKGRPVVVRAKFTQPNLTAMTDAQVRAIVTQGGRPVVSVRLNYVPASPGIYESTLTGLSPGEYNVRLDSPQIATLRQAGESVEAPATTFVVDPADTAERLELTTNAPLLRRLAELSGGVELPKTSAGNLPGIARIEPIVEHVCRQVTLWDTGWMIAAFATIIGAEWILRKRCGLT